MNSLDVGFYTNILSIEENTLPLQSFASDALKCRSRSCILAKLHYNSETYIYHSSRYMLEP